MPFKGTKGSISALEIGTPGATRTHGAQFRKPIRGLVTRAIKLVPEKWCILALFLQNSVSTSWPIVGELKFNHIAGFSHHLIVI